MSSPQHNTRSQSFNLNLITLFPQLALEASFSPVVRARGIEAGNQLSHLSSPGSQTLELPETKRQLRERKTINIGYKIQHIFG